jgi:hypothetical protein
MDYKKLGFKKVFPDNVDKEYFFWRKNIKHPYLKGLHVIVEKQVSVYCKESKMFGGHDVLIHTSKNSNLKDVLKWLETPNM